MGSDASIRRCPKCRLISILDAERCDCGWDFRTLLQERSLLPTAKVDPALVAKSVGRRISAIFLISALLVVVEFLFCSCGYEHPSSFLLHARDDDSYLLCLSDRGYFGFEYGLVEADGIRTPRGWKELELNRGVVYQNFYDLDHRFTWHGFGYMHIDDAVVGGSPVSSTWGLYLPSWFAIATTIALPLIMKLRPSHFRRHRYRRGMCRKCGYDLRATPGRCPECGLEGPDVDLSPKRT